MGAIKRYGPVLGAGVTLTEKPAERAITASPVGISAYAGILEKGPVGEIIKVSSKSDLLRQTGSRLPESLLPDSLQDFWDESRGTGRQYLVRITDGTQRKSELILKSRETTGVGYGAWRDIMKVKAKSGGRWAGAFNRLIGEITDSGDLTETTITTGITMKLDEYKGGTLQMAGISGETFEILGNTIAGIVTVKGDAGLLTKFGASVDYEYTLFKNNLNTLGDARTLEVLAKDGARDPVNEFGLEVYWNGSKVLDYPDLSLDPNSDVYYLRRINDDTGNFEIEVESLFSGTVAPNARPSNQAGKIPTGGLSTLALTLEWYQTKADAGNTGVGAIAVTSKPKTQRDFITLTCTNATTPGSEVWSVVSSQQDRSFPTATTAVAYVGPNDYFIGFTIAAGTPAWDVGDKIYITVEPVKEDEVVGGRLFYDMETKTRNSLEIVSATPVSVSVRPGNDLSALTTVGKKYKIEYRQGMEGGYDGHSGVDDNDYIIAFDLSNSLFNNLRNRQLGLIKYAIPGVTVTAVQKAGRSYAEANNGMFRAEIPYGTTTEESAVEYVEDTLGQNDFMEVTFPSYFYKVDPDRAGLKLVSATGSIMGEEALIASTYKGYHKASAGVDAVLDKVVKLPTGDHVLNDEITNPKGIQVILLKSGNWVLWGDRIPATPTGLVWKHQREQLSHYERVMFENYDWIVFNINDEDLWPVILASFKAFYLPEWKPKRAIRGKTFQDAARFKVDRENNTNLTMAGGDVNAEISLRLADTVERFNIIISPAGIFENLAD